jgi:hypothetical protein
MQDGPRTLTETDLSVTTATKLTQLGAIGLTEDGRQFRYVSAGSALAAGQLAVAPALSSNSTALVIPAQAAVNLGAGSTQLIVTNGATAVAQNQFAEGFVEVLGANGGYAVRISGNTAAAGAGAITLQLAEVLPAAVVAGTNTVNLTASPYASVVTSTAASLPIGVVRTAIASGAFGWVQTYGHALIAATGAITKGAGIAQDTATTAGNVAAAATAAYQVAVAKEAAANGFVAARVAID